MASYNDLPRDCEYFDTECSLDGDSTTHKYEDKEGNIWLVTEEVTEVQNIGKED